MGHILRLCSVVLGVTRSIRQQVLAAMATLALSALGAALYPGQVAADASRADAFWEPGDQTEISWVATNDVGRNVHSGLSRAHDFSEAARPARVGFPRYAYDGEGEEPRGGDSGSAAGGGVLESHAASVCSHSPWGSC